MITKSFMFLVAPCAFLYIRNLLFTEDIFQKYDWLHFVPFLVYFGLTFCVWIGNFAHFPLAQNISDIIKSPFSMLSLSIWLIYAFSQTMMVLNYDLEKFKKTM
ncbi:hypothetical protein ACQ9BO_03350 [Flavobacterium sp. P21]|uniref:hypothetical protein n=1 Tax=Flavobacterium sp. P21 TaxID=3423948 RepID=UPI003D6649D5